MPSEVKLEGELKQTKDGFVYIDVPDEIINGFIKAIPAEVKKPPYFSKKFNNVGAHISVIGKSDSDGLKISEIGDKIEYTIESLDHCKPDGWDEMKQVYFITVKSPRIEAIRKKYDLPAKDHGHEFHITVAVQPNESIFHKLSTLYEEAPEGIALRNSIGWGKKISKAMRNKQYNVKKNQRTPQSLAGAGVIGLQTGSNIMRGSVIKNPRHRKFFGITKPQDPH